MHLQPCTFVQIIAMSVFQESSIRGSLCSVDVAKVSVERDFLVLLGFSRCSGLWVEYSNVDATNLNYHNCMQ